MKISIISDTHLGFAWGTERQDDSFDAFSEALEKSLDSDAVILPGDIFDSRNPNTDTFARTLEALAASKMQENHVKISGVKKDLKKLPKLTLSGLPVIAIHGTHERRTKDRINPIDALERAGFLIYIHGNGVILEKDGERVCIQGFGGVPEQFAETVIKEFDFRPVQGCYNIFMLHQSLSGFVNSPHTLSLDSLPGGFDLYISGHIHEAKKTRIPSENPLLIAGSTIQTQLTKDAPKRRGIWHLDTKTGELEFQELENQRPIHLLEFSAPERDQVERGIEEVLSKPFKKKPLIRLNIKKPSLDLKKDIKSRYSEKAIISFKTENELEEFRAEGLEEHKLSVRELGRSLLRKNLKQANLDVRTFQSVFEHLEEKNPDAALDLLMKRDNKEYEEEKVKKET